MSSAVHLLRNAQNLELVKSEILDMVDRVDSEFTSQTVNVDRLYHRQLIARLSQLRRVGEEVELQDHLPQHRAPPVTMSQFLALNGRFLIVSMNS
jgi:hypothetical protein